jgi:hypothetical protein
MKQIPAYVCEKCGFYKLGEKNAPEVQKHERIPTTGICNSLDGLLVKIGNEQNYLVVRRIQRLSHRHEALYECESYTGKGMKQRKTNLPKELEERLVIICPDHTASHMVGTVLYTNHQENSYKAYTELPPREFQRVSAKLRKKYPDLYANTTFKRELKYKHRSKQFKSRIF